MERKINGISLCANRVRWMVDQGVMCVVFGSRIGLDESVWNEHLPAMVAHHRRLFEDTARLTMFPPALAARLGLGVWKRFEQSARRTIDAARYLTDVCIGQLEQLERQRPTPAPANQDDDDDDDDGGVVAALRRQNVPAADIHRIVADLFLAASDTVISPISPKFPLPSHRESPLLNSCFPN